MKKYCIILIFVYILCILISPTLTCTAAGPQNPRILINGSEFKPSLPPVTQGTEILVYYKEFLAVLGAKSAYDENTKTIKISYRNSIVELQADKTKAKVNGSNVALNVPAKLIRKQIFIPIFFVAEKLGLIAEYDRTNGIVKIRTGIFEGFEEGPENWMIYKENKPEYTTVIIDNRQAKSGGFSLKLVNDTQSPFTAVWNTLNLSDIESLPGKGDFVKASAYIKLDHDIAANQGSILRFKIEASSSDSENPVKTLLADAEVNSSQVKGQWLLVKTSIRNRIPEDTKYITISYEDWLAGTINIDDVYLYKAVEKANPMEKLVLATYMPWFGREGKWHNWEYESKNPDTILPSGKRDIASVYYPYTGAYDSTDPDVLEYHIDLAQSMGIDGFLIDYYGNLQGKEDYLKTTELLFDIADKKDFKLAILYESKIHKNKQFSKDLSKEEAVKGVTGDITAIIDRYSKRASYLKIDGRPVIAVYGMLRKEEGDIFDFGEKDWETIFSSIRTRKKECPPIVIGDLIAPSVNNLEQYCDFASGFFNWNLIQPEVLHADEKQAYDFCKSINQLSVKWAAEKPESRFAVGMIYPGFNDTGVNGWGMGSRVIDLTDKGFYDISWEAVLDDLYDFDMVIIATFNDWNEGTQIEPDKTYGFARAHTTLVNAGRLKGPENLTYYYKSNPFVREYK